MNPKHNMAFIMEALLGAALGEPTDALVERQLMRWHMERQRGWIPLGKKAFTDTEYYTTLERGLNNPATLAEACALTGYVATPEAPNA